MREVEYGRAWIAAIAIVGLLGLGLGGCDKLARMPTAPISLDTIQGEDDEPKPGSVRPKKGPDLCQTSVRFDRTAFRNPTRIDNPWSPLIPGTQYALVGRSNRGGGLRPHRVIFTVTDVTKVIDGIETVVLWDRDFNEGVLAEVELAFFAQDDNGNIWGLGEYPEEFDFFSGEFLGAPNTWISGLEGTVPGTLMLGNLRDGKAYYSQGYAPSVEFLDCARVLTTSAKTCVPAGCFSGVLVIDEYAPFDPGGGNQRKSYARGVGNIAVGAVSDPEGETLVMSDRKQLTPTELAEARAEVLRLDARGYQFNDVYAQTVRAR